MMSVKALQQELIEHEDFRDSWPRAGVRARRRQPEAL